MERKMGKKTKRMILMLAASALCLGSLSACSSKGSEAEQPQVVSALADGVVTVGIVVGDDIFCRREYVKPDELSIGNGGEPVLAGIEVDILNSMAEAAGVSVAYEPLSADQSNEDLMNLLAAGEIDVAAGRLFQLLSYEGVYQPSRYYAKSGLYLVTRENRFVDTLAGFTDAPVGVSQNVPSYELLSVNGIQNVQQTPYSDVSRIPQDLEKGVIDAAICTEREALKLLKAGGVSASELLDSPRIQTVFYISPGQSELLAYLNQAINKFLDNQSMPQTQATESGDGTETQQ